MLEIGVHKMKYLAPDLRYYFSLKFYYLGWVKNFYNVIEVIFLPFLYYFCSNYFFTVKGICGTNLKFFQKILPSILNMGLL
jgi:hypothetical protein